MASSNLDDLLKSIRDEAKKESALVAMDGGSDQDDQLVDEEIDERVLRLLGIEDVFDIDYATYKTLLKEKMMAARMSGSKIPTEEAEVITNEFKRVKGREGRFKVIKKKISVGDIRRTGPLKGLDLVQENPQKLLAPAKEQKKLSPIDSIIESLSNIVKILQERNKLFKKQQEKNRRVLQNRQRSDREAKAEAGMFGKVLEGAKKVIAPVQNLLGRIFEIFMKIIFGRFLMKFIDWFADPENRGKINAIGTFLRDHWPKLLAAYLLFGNGLGRFVIRITAMLVRGAATLLTKVLPQLMKFVLANPKLALLAGAVGLFAAGGVIPKMFPQTVEDEADKDANEAAKEKGKDQAAKDIRAQNEDRNPLQKFGDFITGAGQEREEQAQRLETGEEKRYGFFGELAGGGQVSGPSGTDVVPARLTDGEFVMSKGAVDTFGTDFMESINAAGGGNNRPKKSSGTIYAAGGGQIGGRVHIGGSPGDGYPGGRPGDSKGNDLAELVSGFSGRTSQSENYSVRVINEIAKKVYTMIKADERRKSSPSPSSGGETSAPPSSGERTLPPSSGPNIPGAGVAEEVYNRGKDFIGGIYDAAKPKIDAAMPQVQALPATIDYGSLYLKSQLGGVGGAITEADLSQTTKDEYTRAYQVALTKLPQRRAGVESVIRQQQRILSTPGITPEQKKNAQRTLAINKSRLAKYDAGQVDVQYEDFQVDGKLTPAAAAAQKTMGAVWASDTGDGGFQIEKEPYDFPIVKDPVSLMRWKQLSEEEKYAWLDKQDPNLSVRKKLDPRPPYNGSLGKWGKQDIAEAMYTLNPAAAPMVTDVKIGGTTRPEAIADSVLNTLESIPVIGQASSFIRGLGMNMIFGKTRDVTKGPLEGAAPDSIFRKLFPKQDEQGDPKAINIADQSGGLGSPDPVEKPKLTTAQIKNNQAYAASKGKYYSSTTGKTYASYAEALKDPAVAAGAQRTAKPTYNPLDPKNMTPSQRSKMPAPPEPPVQKTPVQIFNEMVGIGVNDQEKKPTNNTLPNFNASSRSTDTSRTQKLFGIF